MMKHYKSDEENERIVRAMAIVSLSTGGVDSSMLGKSSAYEVLKTCSLLDMVLAARWAMEQREKMNMMFCVDDRYVAAIYACMAFNGDDPQNAEIKVEFEKKHLTITKA